MDQLARTKWGAIYQGNVQDGSETAARFLARYGRYFHVAPEWGLGQLQAQQFLATVRRAKPSAAGMDGWRPREMRLLTLEAAVSIVDILRWIEEHGVWPAALLRSKAVFLSKTEQACMDPEDYRVLLIMPWLYRAWARTWFRHVRG